MPKLSKLVLLPAALSVAACLAVGPGVGRDRATLQAGVSESIRLAPLDPKLAPGNLFDKSAAASLIGKTESRNNWYKTPHWLSGGWHTDKQLQLVSFDLKSGKVSDTNVLTTCHMSLSEGTFPDHQGQLWEYDRQGDWVVSDDDNYAYYNWLPARSHIVANDTTYSDLTSSIVLAVDKRTGVIRSCYRDLRENIIYCISKNAIKFYSAYDNFDREGNPTHKGESVSYYKRIMEFIPNHNAKTPDGKPLYPLFVQFLKDNGMADRIPDGPPSAPGVVAKP
jgi:hypothetical protein